MSNFKRLTIFSMNTVLFMSGCTQVVTAPVDIAGSVVGTTIDVADATVDVVSDSDGEENKN